MEYCDTYDDNSEDSPRDSQPVNNESEEVNKLIVILWTLLMSVAYQDSDLETVTVTCSCKNTCQRTKNCPCKAAGVFCGAACRCGNRRTPCKNKVNVRLGMTRAVLYVLLIAISRRSCKFKM